MKDISKIKLQSNNKILQKYRSYNSSHELIMYHLTTKKNAYNILKNGFDISLSKRGAFGLGINLTTDINHLKNYYDNKTNYLIICLVKFNKKQKNKSGPEIIKENGNEYTKPKYITPSKGYDILYAPGLNIYVVPQSIQVYPVLIGKITY